MTKGTNPIHPSEAMVQLTCTIVSVATYRLVYMGFVHCGGAFQMPIH